MTAPRPPWDPNAPLPRGTTAIEASAGTGKTWQIASLVARLVAEEDVPIQRILAITFTEAASAELRDRIRRRLVAAEAVLGGAPPPADDEVLAPLAGLDTITREAQRARLAQALADFDEAPISTIHGFCQRTLGQLAFESQEEPAQTLLTDPAALRTELVEDELARTLAKADLDDLRALAAAHWQRAILVEIAEEMTGPVAPEVRPAGLAGRPGHAEPWAMPAAWRARCAQFQAWFDGPEGSAARAAIFANCAADQKRGGAGKPAKYLPKWTENKFEQAYDQLATLLSGDDLRMSSNARAKVHDAIRARLSRHAVREAWDGPRVNGEPDFAAMPLFERVDALFAARAALFAAPLVGFAERIRPRFEAALKRRGLLTYDAMLSRLAERLRAEGAGGPLAEAMRGRYQAVLVDEFQDTDEAQWATLAEAFGTDCRLFLIGDPKQSIYGFRGTDIDVYLKAVQSSAGPPFNLTRNQRSDASLIRAMNAAWARDPASHPFDPGRQASSSAGAIAYVQVESTAAHAQDRLIGLPPVERAEGPSARRPFELRFFDGEAIGVGAGKTPAAGSTLTALAGWCADECARLLSAVPPVQRRGDDGSVRDLRPSDLTVLVRTHRQGAAVRKQLLSRGIPALGGAKSKLAESDARPWLAAWLDAVAAPDDERAARAFAVTPLVGWTAARLAAVLDAAETDAADGAGAAPHPELTAWERLRQGLRRAATAWSTQGFFPPLHRMLAEHDAIAGLLATEHGERAVTDLRHLVELAHLEERRARLAPAALAEWVRGQRAGASDEDEARRLETDADAVRIVTVHASKGLQYPVTLLPFAWSQSVSAPSSGYPIRVRLPDGQGGSRLVLDLSPDGSTCRETAEAAVKAAAVAESRRLLYVALTRAEHHVVAWDGTAATGTNPLRAVLLPSAPENVTTTRSTPDPSAFAVVQQAYAQLRAEVPEIGFAAERLDAPKVTYPRPAAPPAPLTPRPWELGRGLPGGWMVASYSSIGGKHGTVAAPATPGEAAAPADAGEPPLDPSLAETVAADALPGGTAPGKWIHEVLELLDFPTCAPRADHPNSAELAASLAASPAATSLTVEEARRALLERLRVAHGVSDRMGGAPEGEGPSAFLEPLLPRWLATPLGWPGGPIDPDFRLAQLTAADRLDELDFDLSLAEGLDSRAEGGRRRSIDDDAVRAALAPVLAREGPARRWLEERWDRRPADAGPGAPPSPILPRIAGILTGSIDLVFRAGGRYFLADYKTNRIVDREGPPIGRRPSRRAHYTDAWLAHEMHQSGYHLQALLYTVALHRMLAARLGAAYRYEQHVGGHFYFFLRGMDGPGTPRSPSGRCLGVFHDRWPREAIVGLDVALAGGTKAEVESRVKEATP